MKRLKIFLAGLVVGLLFGLWMGVNLGRDEPLFRNPFARQPLEKRLKQTGGAILEKGGEVLREKGRELTNPAPGR
ncbi:hypothetical protein G3N55_10220 [Dissulfurirhabdus thermomarina]|uniref:Uncharacterized protein n=1 Tax=Dissulfurirhabdus thermomarina TaxID=1765737 RepID=A0A6N9TTZ6_DISTH|nr:hypothetical protein [Dissulfurirhabdus thermomarina]NDY43214.1 hypothetical protein [Dissulfurirhabdus thermomarina]NMX23932.1 hypothetical protein [Dissulfurirhabdus thermomarina]